MLSMSLEEDISELIQCTICFELLTDTRVLRCGHTFCLRCLQRYGKGKTTGDGVPCPVCRTHFKVPSGGFSSLPRNFMVERILELHAASVAESLEEIWSMNQSPQVRRRQSVSVQSTQTISVDMSTVEVTIQESSTQVEQTVVEIQHVEHHQQQHAQQQQLRQQRQLQQQQQRQHQSHLEQHRLQQQQRRRPFASRKGCSSRLLMNAFLVSVLLNFLLMGNLWYILDSMEQERTNWTNKIMEFEETIQKLKEENVEKQTVINDHHLRCTERVESSMEECKKDIAFYRGFLHTVTKLLDTHTAPRQPTFSVM